MLSYGRSYRSSCSQVRGHPGGPKTPRYIVEHTFPDGLHIAVAADGAELSRTLTQRKAEPDVTWVHSYVSDDKRRTFCVYDALPQRKSERPSPATGCRPTGLPGYRCSTPTPIYEVSTMRRSSKAVTPRFLPPPEGSSLRTTSPGSPPAAARAWLRRVFAVPAAVAMLSFALVIVTPQLSSPVSAQTASCGAPVTGAPTGPATVSAAWSAYGRVLVIGSGEYSGCSLYELNTDELPTLTSGAAPFACTDDSNNAFNASCDTVLWPALLTDGAPIAGRGVNPSLLGTVSRTDVLPGTPVQQVTYGGLPLYRVTVDDTPGQTTGANLFDPVTVPQGVWYLVEPGRGRPAPGQALIEQETAPVYQNGAPPGPLPRYWLRPRAPAFPRSAMVL